MAKTKLYFKGEKKMDETIVFYKKRMKELAKELDSLPKGSDERKEIATELKEIGTLLNEAQKARSDKDSQKKDRVCKIVIGGVEIILPLAVNTVLWLIGLKFEESGTFASKLVGRLLSGLKIRKD